MTKPGGIIHTYQKFDPVQFPSPTQPPPDLVSPAFEHMLQYGSMRRLTEEELARAVRLDPSQIAGMGPSLDALMAMLLERKRKILAKYETNTVQKQARKDFHRASEKTSPPEGLQKSYRRAVGEEQLRDLEMLWYAAGDERSKFAKQLVQLIELLGQKMRPEGTWTLDTVLPKAGCYRLLCDFMPSGGSGQFLTAPLVTAGYEGDLESDRAHLRPDATFKRSDGDLTVAVTFDPPQPVSCQYAHLNFEVTDTTTGRPVTDLQTYLGQFSHMLLLSEDLQCYVHSHPINLVVETGDDSPAPEYIIPPDADLAKIRGGPRVTFDALMPKAGLFRAWAQFQRNDQVRTVRFTFNVAQGTAEPVLT